MNREEVGRAVLGRMLADGKARAFGVERIQGAISKVLEPFRVRDEKAAVLGLPEFNFDGRGVLWCERQARVELR